MADEIAESLPRHRSPELLLRPLIGIALYVGGATNTVIRDKMPRHAYISKNVSNKRHDCILTSQGAERDRIVVLHAAETECA